MIVRARCRLSQVDAEDQCSGTVGVRQTRPALLTSHHCPPQLDMGNYFSSSMYVWSCMCSLLILHVAIHSLSPSCSSTVYTSPLSRSFLSLSLFLSLTLSPSLLPVRQGPRDSPQSPLRSRRRLDALCLPTIPPCMQFSRYKRAARTCTDEEKRGCRGSRSLSPSTVPLQKPDRVRAN